MNQSDYGCARISNSIERAYFDVRTAASNLGRIATGRADLINSKRVLKEIKQVRAALDVLEATAALVTAEARRDAAAKRAKTRKADRQLAAYLARHPDEITRAQDLKSDAANTALAILKKTKAPTPQELVVAAMSSRDHAVEGLIVMAQAAREPRKSTGLGAALFSLVGRKAA